MSMQLFLTTALLVSCAGLIVLLVLKRLELRSGRLILAGIRPKVGGVLHGGVVFIEFVLPSLVLRFLRQFVLGVRALFHRALARGVLLFEHALHRALVSIRDMTTRPPQGGVSTSAFLQEVAAHKRTLQKRSAAKRVILDE